MRTTLLAIAAFGLVTACGDSDPSDPGVSLRAEATDPAGDGGVADLSFASLEVTDSDIRVRVEFTTETFKTDSLLVNFHLDTDEQAGTGNVTSNPATVGMGVDCLIAIGKVTATALSARVYQFVNSSFVATTTVPMTTTARGYEATVPVDACNDDGRALMKVSASRQLTQVMYTVIQDWLPDAGTPPLAVR